VTAHELPLRQLEALFLGQRARSLGLVTARIGQLLRAAFGCLVDELLETNRPAAPIGQLVVDLGGAFNTQDKVALRHPSSEAR
jgi:hypothetical protein